jgi:subtilisin family serine protease
VPSFGLQPIIVHDRVTAFDADLRPWSIEQTGIRKLGTRRGEGVRVGIIDTGISSHGDLDAAVSDKQDFTGSRHGTEAVHSHGVHVAGIIAGRETERGGVGVAPWCRLWIAKALGDDGSGSDESTAAAVNWCVASHVHIINMSLGSPAKMPQTSAAIGTAIAAGVTVVCAAGNAGDTGRSWPASDERVVSVGATDVAHQAADFSEPSSVDAAAPGVKILSTYKGGQYAVLSGTSMAAPWLTGFIAIWFGDLMAAGLTLPTPDKVFERIAEWTEDIGTPGKDAKTGSGLMDAERYAASLKKIAVPSEVWVPRLRFPWSKKWAIAEDITPIHVP